MSRIRKMIRAEMDVEFFSCVHGVAMIFCYGFWLWLDGNSNVPYGIIVEMMILGYVISWAQKLLFIRERAYTRTEYRIRGSLWCVLPMVFIVLAGELLGWFFGSDGWVRPAFYGFMAFYFVMVWYFIELFYKEDSEEMNRLLKRYKERGER